MPAFDAVSSTFTKKKNFNSQLNELPGRNLKQGGLLLAG